MPNHQHISGFNVIRCAGRAISFFLFVASIALAFGIVTFVLVVTVPTRSALVLAPLPTVAWEMPR